MTALERHAVADDDLALLTTVVDEVASRSSPDAALGVVRQSLQSRDVKSHRKHPRLASSTPELTFGLLGEDEQFRYRRGRGLRFDP